jgi:hypothetical protein
MKSFIVALILVAGFSGTIMAGDCANGRCNLGRRSSPAVSGQRVVRTVEGSVVRQNARTSNRRVVRSSH